ncbi:ABC transporter permease protein [Candidatus Paraburkholderia calva]|nr:ABC transporter permease protein [Candidatus Paraburkholderia calva]
MRWFAQYFDSTLWIGATLRSFGIGLLAAFFTAVIATMAALGIARSKSRGTGALFLLFLLPMIVPSIVTAIALFYLCARVGLVATNLGIVILLTTFRGHDWALDHATVSSSNEVKKPITKPAIRPFFTDGKVMRLST